MSVYREGFHIIATLKEQELPLLNLPSGEENLMAIPYKKGDSRYFQVQQLVESYHIKNIERKKDYSRAEVALIDEWAVADQVMTKEEATEVWLVQVQILPAGSKHSSILEDIFKDQDGFITLSKLR